MAHGYDAQKSAKPVHFYTPLPSLQMTMCEFIHAQMTYHARAMELYTAAYQHTQNIREEEIVEVKA